MYYPIIKNLQASMMKASQTWLRPKQKMLTMKFKRYSMSWNAYMDLKMKITIITISAITPKSRMIMRTMIEINQILLLIRPVLPFHLDSGKKQIAVFITHILIDFQIHQIKHTFLIPLINHQYFMILQEIMENIMIVIVCAISHKQLI